jgi:hypothetical protein
MLRNASNSHQFLVAVLSVAASMAPAVHASVLTVFNDRTSFNAAAPGLPVMTFQPVQAQPFVLQAPLSSSNNEGFFTPGDILPGISISNGLGANLRGLYIDFGAVGLFFFDDSLVLNFASGVKAFGVDLFSSEGTLPASIAGTFVVDIYDGAALLGEETFDEISGLQPAQGPFFGVTSTSPITSASISFSGNRDGAPFINNVSFAATSAVAAPEPCAFLLAGAGVLILAVKRKLGATAG